MRQLAVIVFALTLAGCAQVAQPVATRRGETPIQKANEENPIHGEVLVQYGTTAR